MTLLDLDPKWLMFEGRRVGFIFRCPLLAKRNWWQTCFTECFPTFKGTGEARRYVTTDSQCAIVDASAPETKGQWQGCNPNMAWTVHGGIGNADFDTLTVTPSLDGSAGGTWHGFVQNGQIVGGLP
jgi:hypothetical protein